ncbi:hypothetical protein ACOI1C_10085 [Bacillus sp. DJP31]
MFVSSRDIDKLLEATVHFEEDEKFCLLLFKIDIDLLLERTQDW